MKHQNRFAGPFAVSSLLAALLLFVSSFVFPSLVCAADERVERRPASNDPFAPAFDPAYMEDQYVEEGDLDNGYIFVDGKYIAPPTRFDSRVYSC
jgi:hypothetical protein